MKRGRRQLDKQGYRAGVLLSGNYHSFGFLFSTIEMRIFMILYSIEFSLISSFHTTIKQLASPYDPMPLTQPKPSPSKNTNYVAPHIFNQF